MSQASNSNEQAVSDKLLFQSVDRQATLNQLTLEVGLTLELEQVLATGLKLIIGLTGAEVGEIFLLEGELEEPEAPRIFSQAALHSPTELHAAFFETDRFDASLGLPGLTESTRAIFTESLISDPRFLRQKLRPIGFQAGLACPLRVADQLLGSLNLYNRARGWKPGSQDRAFVEDLVGRFAAAIYNCLSFQRLQQTRAALATLSNAVEIVNSSLNPRYVLARLLSEAVKLMGADGGVIYLYKPGETYLQPTATILIDPAWREKPIPLLGSLAAEVMLTATIRTVSDTSQTPERVYPQLEDGGRPGAVVSAPLLRRGQLHGILECYSKLSHNFRREQLTLLAALASHAVLALRNAELHQEIATARHQAELERNKLRAILEHSPEGLFFVSPDGKVVDANQSARDILRLPQAPENLFGFEREYQILQPDGAPFPLENTPIVKALKEQITSVGQEMIMRWPDGVEKHLLFSATPVYDEKGEMLGGFTLFQDVTRLKEAEKLKSKFLSMITHELKTPLASIKGTVSGLLQEDVEWDAASQKRFLGSIEEDVDGMVALVANLLDMARLEAGFMQPDIEECYLSEVVQEAARKLRSLALAAQQQLEYDFSSTERPVAADFTQIERVIVNLVGNALKYSPNNTSVAVSIQPKLEADNRPWVEVAVADRGPGIAPDEREQIFKQFFRGQQMAGRAGRKVGTGLGLAICREIIALHGGHIWVEERPGGGSIFKFSLPAIEEFS